VLPPKGFVDNRTPDNFTLTNGGKLENRRAPYFAVLNKTANSCGCDHATDISTAGFQCQVRCVFP
jgi:hypothetical protein